MDQEKPRRGFTDRRARRLTAHSVVVALVASPPMLLLVSYWTTAPELGKYGWTLALIVFSLGIVSVLCFLAAYWVQTAADRSRDAAQALASAWQDGPVEADPEPPAPAPATVWPIPVPPAPAGAVKRPAAPARAAEPVVPAAPAEPVQPFPAEPVEVTEPAHHG